MQGELVKRYKFRSFVKVYTILDCIINAERHPLNCAMLCCIVKEYRWIST
jgi:hypothetical protein